MTDERLSSVAILHIHEHKDDHIDDVITGFARLNGIRMYRPLLVNRLMALLFCPSFFFFHNTVAYRKL